MASGEAASDRWRDEDGQPSPAQEFTDWWITSDETPQVFISRQIARIKAA